MVRSVLRIDVANMGQNCCAISRLFLHQDIYVPFISLLRERVKELKVGDPLDRSTQIGPLISSNAFDRIQSFISNAKADGLEVVTGSDPSKKIIHPTIITNCPDYHAVAQEEIFGPVLVILNPFTSTDEVTERVNHSKYGLACGVFTNSTKVFEQVSTQVEAGMIWHNTYNIVPPHLPFGGWKQSGMGKDLGIESIHSFTRLKSIYP
jgi:acyl-CoA reductase-like NAD-dependent aldehyde dehydrogenase